MTPERRILIGIEDIKSISLECNQCKVRLSYSPDEMIDLPQTCPNSLCRSVWNPSNTKAAPTEFDAPATVRLLRAIDRVKQEERAIKANSLGQGFRILLGLDER
jgi:hypothetical protein